MQPDAKSIGDINSKGELTMANRSDFISVLPRKFKRMLALQTSLDEHQRGVQKRLWIEAHAHHKAMRNRALSNRDLASPGDSEE